MRNLNPQLAAFFAAMPKEPTEQSDLMAMRQWYANFGPQVGGVEVEMHHVYATSAVARDNTLIPLRVYQPIEEKQTNAIIYFHGGGWVMGDLNSHDKICRNIAHMTQATVIAVDYRLAPEALFPIPVFDAIDATKWIYKNSEVLGIDPKNIALAGDSAGGNLAAVVSLVLRDEQLFTPIAQILIYPSLDLNINTHHSDHSFNRNGNNPPLNAAQMNEMMMIYLQDPKLAENWLASPIKAKSYENLAPALILTADLDPIRDDGLQYAQLLSQSGVDVLHRNYSGLVHGYFEMAGVLDIVQDSLQLVKFWINSNQSK